MRAARGNVKRVRATFNEMLIHLSTCEVKREDYVKEAGGRAVGGDEGSARAGRRAGTSGIGDRTAAMGGPLTVGSGSRRQIPPCGKESSGKWLTGGMKCAIIWLSAMSPIRWESRHE